MMIRQCEGTCSSSITNIIQVDVIVPVHNASSTIVETIESVMNQCIPHNLEHNIFHNNKRLLNIVICCYDDGSNDDSWDQLVQLQHRVQKKEEQQKSQQQKIRIQMCISQGKESRGAGYARNRASELSKCLKRQSSQNNDSSRVEEEFVCLLDSDDVMHPHRIAEQVGAFLTMTQCRRQQTLMGCNFDRIPSDATWHYTEWANQLSDQRLSLERFRELTLLQPTWMLTRHRFQQLGGYIEAPPPPSSQLLTPHTTTAIQKNDESSYYRLIHPLFDNCQTLKLAEDLRFFYAHLYAGGSLHLHRTNIPLLSYRHNQSSQSFRTPRKLLLQLRVKAIEDMILTQTTTPFFQSNFVIW